MIWHTNMPNEGEYPQMNEIAADHNEKEEARKILVDSVADFCKQELELKRIRSFNEESLSYSEEIWKQMCNLGWTSVISGERDGGLDLGFAAATSLCRELGRVIAPEPMLECGIATSALVSKLPNKQAWFNDTIKGDKIVISHFDQLAAQNPWASQKSVTASKRGNHFVLTGQLDNFPLANIADMFVVVADLNNKSSLFLIEKSERNLSIKLDKLSDGTFSGRLTLADVKIEADGLLAKGVEAERAICHSYRAGSLCTSAYLVGLSESLLEITLEYLKTRKQFGKPIGAFQALQHRAVDLYIQKGLASAVLEEAARKADSQAEDDTIQLLVDRAKYRSNEAAIAISRQSVQMHGGIGYTDECDVGLFLNRALALVARYGNNTVLRRKIGEHICRPVENEVGAKNFTHSTTVSKGNWLKPPTRGWNTMPDRQFREVSRAFLEEEYPSELRFSSKRLRWKEIKPWYKRLSEIGWIAPAWPAKYGGMELTPSQQMIYIEEQERRGVGRAPDMGIIMVGPILIQHGTNEQQKTYLPKILSGEQIWCQGYSEPNAGSDLASLRTRADADGDEFIINGQKTWTTLAQDATHMFCLARTSSKGKPQEGISFFLIDLNQTGITIRPIRNIAGHEEFCEVFLDDVRVSSECMVGEINQGWGIAKALLGFERIFLGSPRQSQYIIKRLEDIAVELNLFKDTSFRDHFTKLKLDALDLECNYQKFADIVRRGESLGPDVSVLKIWATETFARLSELLIDVSFEKGGVAGPIDFGETRVDVLSQFYNARPATIYGGSNEIQRNIVSKLVLGLPNL